MYEQVDEGDLQGIQTTLDNMQKSLMQLLQQYIQLKFDALEGTEENLIDLWKNDEIQINSLSIDVLYDLERIKYEVECKQKSKKSNSFDLAKNHFVFYCKAVQHLKTIVEKVGVVNVNSLPLVNSIKG